MLLCVDIGNTQTVFGLYELGASESGGGVGRSAESGLRYHFRLATRADATADEQALLLSQLLSMKELEGLAAISAVVISATNPTVGAATAQMVHSWFNFAPLVVSPELTTGVTIAYDNPKEVGADRIADAVAVLDLYGGAAIVVDFGTATTFDVVSAEGTYLGGAISPGVAISLDALFKNAAALRRVDLIKPAAVVATSTVDSVRSGILYGTAAMVDGMCQRIEDEVGPCTVVGTGGLCSVIAPYARRLDHQEPWLTLHGLRLIWERNGRVGSVERR